MEKYYTENNFLVVIIDADENEKTHQNHPSIFNVFREQGICDTLKHLNKEIIIFSPTQEEST